MPELATHSELIALASDLSEAAFRFATTDTDDAKRAAARRCIDLIDRTDVALTGYDHIAALGVVRRDVGRMIDSFVAAETADTRGAE